MHGLNNYLHTFHKLHCIYIYICNVTTLNWYQHAASNFMKQFSLNNGAIYTDIIGVVLQISVTKH